MVAGSGPDPGSADKPKSKCLYDGRLDSWPAAEIKIKSHLFKLGLADVTLDGPTSYTEAPVHAHAGPLPSAGGDYFYSLRDTDINGPHDGKTILEVVKVLSNTGALSPDSIYIYHPSITNNDWEPWSSGLINKIAVDTALISSARRASLAPSTPYVSSDASTVPMASLAGGTARSLDFGSPGSATSARDRELGQQRPRTRESDLAAYHTIISVIDDSSEYGEMLILTIGNKFEGNESGHLLYNYLKERASCGRGKEGIVNADELKRKIDDYKICENKPITLEELTLATDHFRRLWEQQPIQRQGMGGDMFDAFVQKLPHNPFIKDFIGNMNAVNVLNDGVMHADYANSCAQLRALYAQWLKTNPPVKGKSASTSTNPRGDPHALVGEKGKGKGKGAGGGRGGGKGGKGGGTFWCFRCWQKNDHWSGSCPQPPGVCTACGMDSAKARLSCGGEQDPRCCILKGYRPEGGVSQVYLARLQDYAKNNNLNMPEPSGARALAASSSVAGAQSYAASVVGPADSVSVAGGEPNNNMALAASQGFDPNNVSWHVVDGMWRPGGSLNNTRTALVAPSALIAFGGRDPMKGEIDCVVDGACNGFCVPSDELLVNIRPPEIEGMHVGNNNWCPATATGDLVSWVVDTDGNVHEFTRVRHVVPKLKWHLHGETPEFEGHGGVVTKGKDLVMRQIDDTALPLLPGDDGMVRLPLFRTRELALEASAQIVRMHAAARAHAARTITRLVQARRGGALVGQPISTEQADKYLLWHAILGCKGDETLRTTLTNSSGHGSVQVPHDAGRNFGLCDFCNTQKLVAQPHPDATHHASYFGQRVLIDDLGPFKKGCILTGAKYVRKFTDEATGFRAAYPLTQYNSEETMAVVKMFMGDHAKYLPEGKTFNIVRSDGGSVLRAECVRDLLDDEMVTAEASMPRLPQQMGQNEVSGRDMVRTSNAMRARARAAGMPCGPEYAVLGFQYACDVHNLTYHRTWRGNTCPYQMVSGRQPDMSPLHAFGAKAFSRVTTQERPDKLADVGIIGQFVGLARGYQPGTKLLIRDPVQLKRAGIGGIRPAIHVHVRSKLGIDVKVDDMPLARQGRKLLPSIVDPLAVSKAYPRKAPPVPEEKPMPSLVYDSSSGESDTEDGPVPARQARRAPDEGAAASASSGDKPRSVPKPRKVYVKERPDGSKWQTRQSTRVENALAAHATEAEIVSNAPNRDGMGAYFTTEETVQTVRLGDLPEYQWHDDNLFALVHFDEYGNLRVVGDEVKRHPYVVRVDKPGVDIESVALMAKVGDNADGVHVFNGRSDITNEPDAEEWIKARGREVQQLRSIPTWKHVKLKVLQKLGIKPTRTMFVDRVKRTDKNKIEEFKSRGVACQFNAVAGRDYVDKFWHVARDSSINSTLAKGTQKGVKLYQIDLPAFYLQADPKDANFEHEKSNIIYISMLPGYAEKDDDGDEAAGVLTAAMYGTAIAGRAAGRKLSKDFTDFGLSRGSYDHAVYRMEKDGKWIEICCIVDDMVVADYGDSLIFELRDYLQQRWGSGRRMSDGTPGKPIKFSSLAWCLGRTVRVNTDLGIVMVTGPQYIEDMQKKYMTPEAEAIVEKFKADVPCDKVIAELSTVAPRQLPDAASVTRSLVQSLAYAAHKFKNEILYAVGRLQRFADKPCDGVYMCALQVLKYCIRDKEYGTAWSRSDDDATLKYSDDAEPYVSVDSSWQVHDKALRSRSTTGMIFFWKDGPISVRSIGQKFQAITSTDAESHGIASAMYEGIVIRGHLMETGVVFTKPTRLENDNSGGVLVARDAASMHHSRATAMRAVFCQECVEQGMYDPVHVPAEKMTADILTKWLPLNDFAKHRAKLTNRRAQSKMLELK